MLLGDQTVSYTGTFANNQLCGITVYTNKGRRTEYECKENRCHGKQTDYTGSRGGGNIHNVILNHGEIESEQCKPITNNTNAVFYRNGKAVQALKPNVKEFV